MSNDARIGRLSGVGGVPGYSSPCVSGMQSGSKPTLAERIIAAHVTSGLSTSLAIDPSLALKQRGEGGGGEEGRDEGDMRGQDGGGEGGEGGQGSSEEGGDKSRDGREMGEHEKGEKERFEGRRAIQRRWISEGGGERGESGLSTVRIREERGERRAKRIEKERELQGERKR